MIERKLRFFLALAIGFSAGAWFMSSRYSDTMQEVKEHMDRRQVVCGRTA